MKRAVAYQPSKSLSLQGPTGDHGLRGEQCACDAQPHARPGARGHDAGAAVADGLHQVEHDEPEHQDEVRGVEPVPHRRRAADVGLRRGEGPRPDVRCERGADGQQGHDDEHHEYQDAAARDADAELDAPRQQRRDDEQRHREPVAHAVGAGGHVADSGPGFAHDSTVLIPARVHKPPTLGARSHVLMHAVTNEADTSDDLDLDRRTGDDGPVDAYRGHQRRTRPRRPRTSLHTSGAVEGLITALPVVCFAVLGALTPRMSQRVGSERLLVVALILAAAGTALRSFADSAWVFAALSIVALSGGAVSNVLLPSLVKSYFPERIGGATAVYTTALAVGSALAIGLTVPIGDLGDLGDGWRLGLGSWAALTAIAAVPWLMVLMRDRPEGTTQQRVSLARLASSRTAWSLTAFFGFQSMQAYIAFGWFAKFLHAQGIAPHTAGWMVAVYSAVSIPVSMIVPTFASTRPRAMLTLLCACSLVGYAGMATAPNGGAWVWMVLVGIGAGTFPFALVMIGLRSRHAESTAALSSFVQSIGYVISGLGPLLFGVLYGWTRQWALPLALLFAALALTYLAGWAATRERFVDDELSEVPQGSSKASR